MNGFLQYLKLKTFLFNVQILEILKIWPLLSSWTRNAFFLLHFNYCTYKSLVQCIPSCLSHSPFTLNLCKACKMLGQYLLMAIKMVIKKWAKNKETGKARK